MDKYNSQKLIYVSNQINIQLALLKHSLIEMILENKSKVELKECESNICQLEFDKKMLRDKRYDKIPFYF